MRVASPVFCSYNPEIFLCLLLGLLLEHGMWEGVLCVRLGWGIRLC